MTKKWPAKTNCPINEGEIPTFNELTTSTREAGMLRMKVRVNLSIFFILFFNSTDIIKYISAVDECIVFELEILYKAEIVTLLNNQLMKMKCPNFSRHHSIQLYLTYLQV